MSDHSITSLIEKLEGAEASKMLPCGHRTVGRSWRSLIIANRLRAQSEAR